MSLSAFIKRKRASTKSLLGTDYQETVDDKPAFPEPLKDPRDYDQERLKQGLKFVDQTLRNTKQEVSPITNHLLTIYKATIKEVLETTDESERQVLLNQVIVCDRDIYTKRFLRCLPSDEVSSDLVGNLADLRRFEFAARYGDYMTYVCEKLKTGAKAEKTEHFESLTGWDRLWIDINSGISRESSLWKKWELRQPDIKEVDIKTTLGVYSACNHMGLDFDNTLQTIAMYADRNGLVHKSILQYVERGQWHHLAKTLAQDIRDLPAVTPHHLRPNIPVLQDIIQTIVDEYFTCRGSALDYEAWVPKDSSFEKAIKMREVGTRHQDAAIEERKTIKLLAAKRCEDTVKKHSLVHITAPISGNDGPSGGVTKRRASTYGKDKRMETFKRQKKAWDAMISIQARACKQSTEYHDEFGAVELPIEPLFWFDLDDEDDSPTAP